MDRALEFQRGAQGVATYLLLRLPSYYLPYLVPVTSFAAAFLAIGRRRARAGDPGAKAGGIPPQRVAAARALSPPRALSRLRAAVLRDRGARQRRRLPAHARGRPAARLFSRAGTLLVPPRALPLQRPGRGPRRRARCATCGSTSATRAGACAARSTPHSARIEPDHQWELFDATIRVFDNATTRRPPRASSGSRAPCCRSRRSAISRCSTPTPARCRCRSCADYIDAMVAQRPRLRPAIARCSTRAWPSRSRCCCSPCSRCRSASRSSARAAWPSRRCRASRWSRSTTRSSRPRRCSRAGGVAVGGSAPWLLLGGFGGFGAVAPAARAGASARVSFAALRVPAGSWKNSESGESTSVVSSPIVLR